MNSASGSNVSASYSITSQFSNNAGSSTSTSYSGHYTWSSSSFTYVNGTDNEVGYSKPTYVWFAIDPSLSVGDTFHVLNTQFTVLSKNYSLQLPSESNNYVQTIQGKGAGQYQRNDEYGVFTASYTWYEYFDTSTGYIVGYNYIEQDNGQYQGQTASFTYTDDLYVTSTSYTLTPAATPATGNSTMTSVTASGSLDLSELFPFLSLAVLFIIVVIVVVAIRRKGKARSLPKHSPYMPPPTSPSIPLESKIDLGSRPAEQVVIRDVAKVNCRYCGTLIPTTDDRCPYCGGSMR
jgi:hypothetical protein